MLSKTLLVLGAASLGLSANVHRHEHLHNKRAIVTDIEIVTEVVTVTVDGSEPTSTSKVFMANSHSHKHTSSSSTSSTSSTSTSTTLEAPSTTSTTPEPTTTPTTLATVVASVATTTSAEINVNAVTTAAAETTAVAQTTAVATTAAATTASSSSGWSRGLAYNSASLLSSFLGSNTQCKWKYNWDQKNENTADGLNFVPMLWGLNATYTDTWNANVETALKSDLTTHLLSFNEPDLAAQAALSPSAAAAGHITWMNPFSSKAKIGTPAITNSPSSGTDNVGIGWLYNFLQACNGGCSYDFTPIHWYNLPNVTEFLTHAHDVFKVSGKPIWVTEFAPVNADSATIQTFLKDLFIELNTGKYSYLERIAYFDVDLALVSGTAINELGTVYAYTA